MRLNSSKIGLLACLAGGLIFLSAIFPRQVHSQPVPQQVVPAGGVQVVQDDPNAPKAEGYQSFTFPEERDSKQRLQAVMDYLEKKTVPWDVVCGTAQQLLDARSDSFFPIEQEIDGKKSTGGRVSIKAKINDLIGELPKEGREFYELAYGPLASDMYKRAVANHFDKSILAEVSQRYFHTKAGAEATLLLATLDLETGHYAEAAYGFQRLLSRPQSDEYLTPRTLFKAAVALRRAGDPRQAEAVGPVWARLERSFPRDGLTFGRKSFTIEELKSELDRPFDRLFGQLGDAFATVRMGNPSHTGRSGGGTPFLDPVFMPIPLTFREDTAKDFVTPYGEGNEWVRQHIDFALKGLDQSKGEVVLPGFFPVTAPSLIFYRAYDGVYAVVTKDGYVSQKGTHQEKVRQAGEVLWMADALGAASTLMSGLERGIVQQWWSYWQTKMPSILFENAQVGSLSHDGRRVYFIDDLAIPPPPQSFGPNMGGLPQGQGATTSSGSDKSVKAMVEYNKLIALDIETGKLLWSLGGPVTTSLTEGELESSTNSHQLTEGSFFLGPPMPLNGKLYVLYERDTQIRLACFDPSKLITIPAVGDDPGKTFPELVWTQVLGSPNTRLSQDSLRRIQPAYLTYADGVMICPTNCGAVVGVDVNARSLLWARYYGSVPDTGPMIGEGGGRRVIIRGGMRQPNFPNQALPMDRWRASAPIIAEGKVVLTAHDSDQILCLELRSGELIWSHPRQKDDLYIGGVAEGKVIVVGKESVRAYTLAGGPKKDAVLAWPAVRTGTPTGHGVIGEDGMYYLPVIGTSEQQESKEPQVWAIDIKTGTVKPKTTFRRKTGSERDPRTLVGNLIFHEGQLISQSGTELSAFPLIELKRQEMARLLKQNPNDPVGLTDRGELSLDNGDIKEAIADFKEAQKHDPPETTRRRIREKLYIAYTELLRNKFEDGEPYLEEYETLCELPIDSEDPLERQRLMDEQLRRKGLYLSLVAKGREKQGRLVDAFEYYRAFASLGDNKQLVPIYDEPNGKTRPDVWARGRIEAMIRNAKDPSARKPLEEHVQKDWNEVRTANDLPRLEEFVRVFGPYFASGREAQLLLSEKLLQSNDEEKLREAQTHLMQLWATAEEPVVQARAIEALARVMTRRGMLEDAVGLYAQLGTRYGNIVVRDGKTGADIYSDLITDKRLLPFLEPGRGPTSSRYKVEVFSGPQNRMFSQSFMLVPEGELFPFFRRFDLMMEQSTVQTTQGEMAWSLKVMDRATGEARCKFGGIAGVQLMINSAAGSLPRMAQANGHLVLMTAGANAYCFDLAEKRELWRYPLLGASINPNSPPQAKPLPDGDIEFQYEDGWRLRLGCSAILQPTYVCLVTRDGLVALDPSTGQKLWLRTNVSTRVQVFGDSRYVFVVDGNSSRVLRAMDGMPIDGVKEFASLVNSPARVAMHGRQVLLNEGGGEQARVLRLYDPLTGEDVWKKEYPAQSQLLKSLDSDMTGCLLPDGRVEVLAVNTGEAIFSGSLDADRVEEHIKGQDGSVDVTEPVLLADAERLYLFLNRKPGPAAQGVRRAMVSGGQMNIRNIKVNGVAYGFDRATGKRLWFTERLFENQVLFLERLQDLPVLVAATEVLDPKTHVSHYQVAVLDKQLGKLKYYKGHPQSGFFMAVSTEPRTGAVEFWRYDLRVKITPEEDGRAE